MTPIAALIYLGFCALIGYIGRDKKFGFIGNFLISLFFSPVVGLIVWLVQPELPPRPAVPEKA